MYHCDVCGRATHRKIRMGGHTLCSKHMHQLHKHGRFLDSIPRTVKDLNDYQIRGEAAFFNLYNQRNEKVAEFTVDLEDLEKVRYHKWRLSHGHVVTGCSSKGQQRDLSHVVLGFSKEDADGKVIDHRDGNPLNNRKRNLRICTQPENLLNKALSRSNTSGYTGVSYDSQRDRYAPEIQRGYSRCHLGRYRTLEEALYARLTAERIVFGDWAREDEQERKVYQTANLSEERKQEIAAYVSGKLARRRDLGNQLRGST